MQNLTYLKRLSLTVVSLEIAGVSQQQKRTRLWFLEWTPQKILNWEIFLIGDIFEHCCMLIVFIGLIWEYFILSTLWFSVMHHYGINDPKVSISLIFLGLRNSRLFCFICKRIWNPRKDNYNNDLVFGLGDWSNLLYTSDMKAFWYP